mgnify:CR=1 FL=1
MNLLGPLQNRQEPAQMAKTSPWGSCIGPVACQSLSQANAQSPRFAVVRKSHYPSPSSPRFRTFWSEPGFFCEGAAAHDCARKIQPQQYRFANHDGLGTIGGNNKTIRGSQKCKLQKSAQKSSQKSAQKSSGAPVRLAYWRDASGMTLNGRGPVRPPALWLHKQPVATCLPVRSSARAQVRFATILASGSVTNPKRVAFDRNQNGAALRGTRACFLRHSVTRKPQYAATTAKENAPAAARVRTVNLPARGLPSGGFFVANVPGATPLATT